jgi:hypothetical protein
MTDSRNHDQSQNIAIAGADLFADSESFLNELTDSEAAQVVGGLAVEANADVAGNEADVSVNTSTVSLLLC